MTAINLMPIFKEPENTHVLELQEHVKTTPYIPVAEARGIAAH
jgi:hypothetical protein